MRASSILSVLAVLASTANAASLFVRQSTPTCSTPCFDTTTNGVSTGDCAYTDFACLCRSGGYVQGVLNCIAIHCPSADDRATAGEIATVFCNNAGVNTAPAGITTPTAQLSPTSTPTGNAATNSTTGGSSTKPPAAGSSGASSSAAPASSSTRTGAAASKMVIDGSLAAGLILAAAGLAAGL